MRNSRSREATLRDSRYIPFTQQPSCCVPACISMVMYRRGIPLLPLELLGWHLGVIISPENRELFWKARSGPKPISGWGTSGWGTYLSKGRHHPNRVFPRLQIPLEMIFHPISSFTKKGSLRRFLIHAVEKDLDCIVCYDTGVMHGRREHTGHACVLDRVYPRRGTLRLIDPGRFCQKWTTVPLERLYRAMKSHGDEKFGGVWEFRSPVEASREDTKALVQAR
jgi:hypothetical protein